MGPLLLSHRSIFPGTFAALREVKAGEFTEVFLRCNIIGARCLDFTVKSSKPDFFLIEGDSGRPLVSALIAPDTDVFGSSIFSLTAVLHILSMSRQAEVGPTVIEGVAIFVVNKYSIGRLHNLSVDTDGLCLFGAD